MLSTYAMEDAKRAILDRVVQGIITPAEAAVELEQVERSESAGRVSSPPVPEPMASALKGVRVISQMGSVVVIGDPSVRDVSAEGPHMARREGDTMVIEVEPRHLGGGEFQFGRIGLHNGGGRRLVVKMNPDLAFHGEVQAGSLKVHNLLGPIHAVVQAGSTTVDDCVGPYDIRVSAGSFKAHTRVAKGASRVHCEAGSVRIQLREGSNCRIQAQTTMGKISLPNGHHSSRGFGDQATMTVGEGVASLDIQSTMGSVLVASDQ